MHGLHLLLTLGTRIVQCLVLLLDQIDLAFDLLLPLVLVVLCALLVLLFEFSDLLKLRLFFDLEDGLLDGLGEENVEDGLHFTVILE